MRAVLEVDFLREARKPRAFVVRGVVAAVAAAFLLLPAVAGWREVLDRPDLVGARIFNLLAGLTLAVVTVIAPALTVGTLLVERERGTLPILLCTPLTPRGLALGKMLSRAGLVLGAAAVVLPSMVVAVLLGGVPWSRVFGLPVALVATVLELGAVALFVSGHARRLTTAAVLVYALPLARWALVSPLLALLPTGTWGAAALGTTGPFGAFFPPASIPTPAAPWERALAPWLDPLLAFPALGHLLFALALAAVAVPGAARSLVRAAEGSGPREFRVPRLRGETRWLRRILGDNPVAWKEASFVNAAASRSAYYGLVGLLLVVELGLVIAAPKAGLPPMAHIAFAGGAATLLAALGAVHGAATVHHERTNGTLDVLRLTRLGPAAIMRGKVLGIGIALGWVLIIPLAHLALAAATGGLHPLTALAAASVMPVAVAAHAALALDWGVVAPAPWAAVAGAVALPFIGTVGSWACCLVPAALVAQHMTRGTAAEFFRAVVVPGLLCGVPFLVVWGAAQSTNVLVGAEGLPGGIAAGVWAGLIGWLPAAFSLGFLIERLRALPLVFDRRLRRDALGGESPLPLTVAGFRVPPPDAAVGRSLVEKRRGDRTARDRGSLIDGPRPSKDGDR